MSNPNHCPKCHARLSPGSYWESGASCPRCGLIFAKYRAAQKAASCPEGSLHQEQPGKRKSALGELLLSVPNTISRPHFYANVTGWLLFVIWSIQLAALDYRTGKMNQSFLHGPLLLFHEAGHVIFRLFGHFFMVLGGSLGQLLMPLIILVALLRSNRDPLGASLALWLFGVSLLDVSPYAYDALHPRLILLNGATGEDGGHDWIFILSHLGLLQQSQTVGALFYWLGILTIGMAVSWSALLLYKLWHRLH